MRHRRIEHVAVSLALLAAAWIVGPRSILRALDVADITYTAGVSNDRGSYVPPLYTGFVPTGHGQTFTDPTFGTRITRLTEGGAFHEYSTMTPFNADDTLVAVFTSAGYWLVSRAGHEVASREWLDVPASGRLKWHRTDPALLYYYLGNEIRQLNVVTGARTVVKQFTQFRSIDDGGGSSDLSEDGDHLIVVGDARYIGVFQISTGRLGRTLDTKGFDADTGVDIAADNRVVVGWADRSTSAKNRVDVYDSEMNYERTLDTSGGHWDLGRDVDGTPILLSFAWADAHDPPGCEQGGLIKTRVGDGVETCVANGFGGSHISAVGAQPWVVVTTMDLDRGTMSPQLPSNWQARWQPFDNEVLLIKTDGTEVRRLVHHRSRVYGSYWFSPFASRSASGRFVAYNTNMGAQPFKDYADVYLLDLGAVLPTPPATPPIAGAPVTPAPSQPPATGAPPPSDDMPDLDPEPPGSMTPTRRRP